MAAAPTTLKLESTTLVEDRALSLLGSGVAAENVAAALGVTAGRISQLLANKEFADKVASLRYDNLQQHNVRDASYDDIEDKLIAKLDKQLPMLLRPMDVIKALQVVSGIKRRGQTSPETATDGQSVVPLILPTVIAQKFTTNIFNQVTSAGDQELITMQSSRLLEITEEKEANAIAKEETNVLLQPV